jgi:hypothetical protein
MMNSKHKSQNATDDSLKTLEKNIEVTEQQSTELKKRCKDLIDRQEALARQNGGEDAKPCDIMVLNVNGTEMFARRDTLTIVEGSRLEALFSGRWENQLLRDSKGRIFLDLNPLAFRKILEYLYILKIKDEEDDNPGLPYVSKDIKLDFDEHMDFLALYKTLTNIQRQSTSQSANSSASKDLNKIEFMAQAKFKLDETEKKIEVEESFVSYFTKEQSSTRSYCEKASNETEENDDWTFDKTPSVEKISNVDLGILNIYINGEKIVVKRSTLCFDPDSKLAQHFSDDDWVQEHSIITENGDRMILVEKPAHAFKEMVSSLQRMNRSKAKRGNKCQASFAIGSGINSREEMNYLRRVIVHYFSVDHHILKSIDPAIKEDSNAEDNGDSTKTNKNPSKWLLLGGVMMIAVLLGLGCIIL